MIKIMEHGLHFCFEHCTVSIQIGKFNYCQSRERGPAIDKDGAACCPDAEVAVMDNNGRWLTKEMAIGVFKEDPEDDVMGWIKTDNLPEILIWAKTYVP